MSRNNRNSEIEIHRNPVEAFLMSMLDFIKNNRKIVGYAFLGILLSLVIAIVSFLMHVNASEKNQIAYESIMVKFTEAKSTQDDKKLDIVISDLKKFIESTSVGFAHEIAHYTLGNIYFEREKFKESKEYLIEFGEKTSSDILGPMALNKAALALEELGSLKKAISLHKKIEKDYPNSVIADQTLYHLCRLSFRMKNPVSGNDYYRKLKAGNPNSVYIIRARKRVMIDPLLNK